MISCAAGGLALHFFRGANLLLFGQNRIYVFSELCRCCVKEVVYTCRAMYGCRVGALRSLEGVQSIGRFAVPQKNGKSLYVQKNIYLCILKALYKKSKQY